MRALESVSIASYRATPGRESLAIHRDDTIYFHFVVYKKYIRANTFKTWALENFRL